MLAGPNTVAKTTRRNVGDEDRLIKIKARPKPERGKRNFTATCLVVGLMASAPSMAKGTADAAECTPPEETLEGLPIVDISIENGNIFDPEIEGQDLWIHRLANTLHIKTQKKTIDELLLFDLDEPYDERLVQETERSIRSQGYIHDVRIESEQTCEQGVEVKVISTDNWTFSPSLSVGHSGGETRTTFELEENNLLGLGTSIKLKSESDEDRDENSIAIHDNNWFGNHKNLSLTVSDNSDGYYYDVELHRPFFQLDSRYAWSGKLISHELERPVYTGGVITDKVGERSEFFQLSYGWSDGLVDGEVLRYQVGWTISDVEYFQTSDFPNSEIPDPVSSSYPFFSISWLRPEYVTLTNFLVMGVNEDVSVGDSFSISIGLKNEALGSDERGLIIGISYGLGSRLGERTLGFADLSLSVDTNEVSDDTGFFSLAGRLYHYRNEDHSYLLNAVYETSLNAENFEQFVLGGDSGLKGYPIRYQKGDSRMTLGVEDRLFFKWYPLQMLKFGAAVFAETGSAWSDGDSPNFISDAGFGLRVVSTRQSHAKVLHADIAFPFNEKDQVDKYQFFLKAQAQF